VSTDLQRQLDAIPAVAPYALRVQPTEDGVRFRGELAADAAVYEGVTVVHGGVVASVLDTAATFAIVAVTGARWVTVDLRVDYLRPTSLGKVACVARALTHGGRIGVVQAELTAADGTLTALAVATMSRAGEMTPA
jgi:uncharacterized protein (TIGR00369 family)